MRKLFTGHEDEAGADEPVVTSDVDITNGALDTLSSVIQTMGEQAFLLDTDRDPNLFPRECADFVRHIENGEAVPTRDIPRSLDGSREWPQIRSFFSERRRAERSFVSERIGNYRDVVEDLIAGLRQIGERDQDTQRRVSLSLSAVENAVGTGDLMKIREVLKEAVHQVTETFEQQQQAYEQQLSDLHKRMDCLREDLVAAREEMKRDSLTDAFNRGAFDSAIEQSLNMHFVLQQPVTLLMIDLDKFKEVNDRHGHSCGDQVLKAMGECLARAFIRKSDLVARYGGDEFAVILNETSAANAEKVIERFVASVGKIAIPTSDGEISISCSVGYTELHDRDTVEQAINRADRGLYSVKSRGGNGSEYVPFIDETPLN
ncbi:MAG: GGDEF domain-containing protein [Woeseiaceae bacterium]|nr:GGDEF domain-containing protein [Woeseiaceae bacterium]